MAVCLITYNGLVTGSLELRTDNKRVFELLKAAPNKTPIGQYAFVYDDDPPNGAGKVAEPYFDGFLSCIAGLSDGAFNVNFAYLRTEKESDAKPGLFANINPEELPRSALGGEGAYQGGVHIYLLGPASPSCVEQITACIQANPGRLIFIHVQGEAPNEPRPPGEPRTPDRMPETAEMMTVKPGMFQIAFNYYTGTQEMIAIRRLATQSFTVKVKRPGDRPGKYVPVIYQQMLDFTLSCILTTTAPPTTHPFSVMCARLDNQLFCQDTHDKDNLVAGALTLLLSGPPDPPDAPEQDPPVLVKRLQYLIIGRRAYPDLPGSVIFHGGMKERIAAVSGAPFGSLICANGEVQSPPVIEWPDNDVSTFPKQAALAGTFAALSDAEIKGMLRTNGPLEQAKTMAILGLSTNFFEMAIRTFAGSIGMPTRELVFFPSDEGNITDGMGAVALSGNCPFPENMYSTRMYELMAEMMGSKGAALGGRKRRTKNKRKNKKRTRRHK